MTSTTKYCFSVSAALIALGLCSARADIRDTIQAATSGSTVTCSGSYSVSARITVPSGVTVKGGTFNFTDSSQDGFYVASGSSSVTLSGLTVKGANHGIMIYGASCKITSCTACANYNSGIEIIGTSAKNNTISGCVSYNNADSSGGNADGFAAKNSTSTGNKISSCTAYSNSDDGYDYFSAASPITTSSCQAYSNGSYGGKTGNGDGFKMGGSGYSASHVYTSCIAHNNTAGSTGSGFDSNNNGSTIYLTTCHSYSNKQADRLVNCSLSSCTMQN